MGTAAIGRLYEDVPEAEARETIALALGSGISYFDTAPLYGAGLAERRLGAALAGTVRDSFIVSTKVGRLVRPAGPGCGGQAGAALTIEPDLTEPGIRRSLEESLDRLGLDRVDIAYLHDPDDYGPDAWRSGLPTLLSLRDEGVVRAVGVGMNQAEMLAEFVRDFDIDLVLLAGRYTLLDQSGLATLLPRCAERHVGVVIGGVFNSGVLADPGARAYFNYRPAPPELVEKARSMAAVCERHHVSLRAVALKFPFGHPAVVSVLQGASNRKELRENVADFSAQVPAACWHELRSEGLIPPGVPLPGGDA
jgi:D-threo-aldose 1-dehydrogenase